MEIGDVTIYIYYNSCFILPLLLMCSQFHDNVCSCMPPIVLTNDPKDGQFDGVIVVSDSLEHLPTSLQSTQGTIDDYLKVPIICFCCIMKSHLDGIG